MLTIIIAIIVVILDQLTKYVAASQGYSHCSVINNFFYLNYSENTGMAWSLFSGHPYLLAVLGIVAVLLMVLYLYKNPPKKLESIIFGFIIGGAIGNLIDRLFLGYVRDFLDFYIFGYDYPIFNVADSFICVGVFLLLVNSLINTNEEKDGKDNRTE